MDGSTTGIELSTKYFILNFIIVIFPFLINVDGTESRGKWGTNVIPLTPGSHTISLSWKLYWFLPVNKATTTVSVAEGQVVQLQYYAPWFFLLPGKVGPTPAAA